MSQPETSNDRGFENREEMMSALFGNMIAQQTNMAFMFMGRVPHPESGERIRDLNTARMFIDQLEMLEVKTKGNLDKHEDAMLKQSLTALRMAFVEAVNQEQAPSPRKEPAPPSPGAAKADAAPTEKPEAGAPSPTTDEAESRKKFSKKY